MITTERIADIRHEMEPLIALHHEEIESYVPFKPTPKWDQYEEMDDAGMLRVVTVRHDGTLVGYAVTIVVPHLHYDTWQAINDSMYLHPDHRGLTSC